MTTILCDGEYIVADRRLTCTRSVNNDHAKGATTDTDYRFVVDDSNKIAKIHGVKINGKIVKAVAISGSSTEAADFLRDLQAYVAIRTSGKKPLVSLKSFLEMRGVFKIPHSGSFSILFLAEGKEVTVLRVSASSKSYTRADGVSYQTEVVCVKHYDFSDSGKHKGDVVGIGSGSEFYNDLEHFIEGPSPHVLDTFVYCVNLDHERSSRNFSVYSLELDHLDNNVELTYADFDERLRRFVGCINLTLQPLGYLSIATRVSSGD